MVSVSPMLCSAMLCFAVRCYAVLWFALICYAMICTYLLTYLLTYSSSSSAASEVLRPVKPASRQHGAGPPAEATKKRPAHTRAWPGGQRSLKSDLAPGLGCHANTCGAADVLRSLRGELMPCTLLKPRSRTCRVGAIPKSKKHRSVLQGAGGCPCTHAYPAYLSPTRRCRRCARCNSHVRICMYHVCQRSSTCGISSVGPSGSARSCVRSRRAPSPIVPSAGSIRSRRPGTC